jgi:hypothetical protein
MMTTNKNEPKELKENFLNVQWNEIMVMMHMH